MNAFAGRRAATTIDVVASAVVVAAIVLALLPAHVTHGDVEPRWATLWRWEIELPRVQLAALLGSGVGAAGWICQRIAHNALASPALLGIPSAAGCGVVVLLAVSGAGVLHSYAVPGAAAVGGLVGAALLLGAAELRHAWDGTQLLLVGVALGALFAAVAFAVALHTEPFVYQYAMAWLAGSLAAATWQDLALLAPPWALLLAVCLWLTPQLLVLGFDDDTAGSLGLSPRRARRVGFGLATTLTALCVSAGGAFAFVGFAAPHLACRLAGTRGDRPGTAALVGAAMLVLADVGARRAIDGVEVPAGIAVAALCIPWLLFELLGGRREVG